LILSHLEDFCVLIWRNAELIIMIISQNCDLINIRSLGLKKIEVIKLIGSRIYMMKISLTSKDQISIES